jgi:hypothetical protein
MYHVFDGIDEFEVGEKITLLPGGASMPSMGFASATWLMERQGCCAYVRIMY